MKRLLDSAVALSRCECILVLRHMILFILSLDPCLPRIPHVPASHANLHVCDLGNSILWRSLSAPLPTLFRSRPAYPSFRHSVNFGMDAVRCLPISPTHATSPCTAHSLLWLCQTLALYTVFDLR
jgi:hypothetical protein